MQEVREYNRTNTNLKILAIKKKKSLNLSHREEVQLLKRFKKQLHKVKCGNTKYGIHLYTDQSICTF